MSLFRSEEMGLYTLNVEKNYAWEVMETIGKHSSVHFFEYDKEVAIYSRPYINMVQRCDEALKKISQIKSMCIERVGPLTPPRNVEVFFGQLAQEKAAKRKDEMAYFEEMEQSLNNANSFLNEENRRAEDVFRGYSELLEKELALKKAAEMVQEKVNYDENPDAPAAVLERQVIRFSYIAGLILKEDAMRFKRIVFRKSRGNAMVLVEGINEMLDEYDKELLGKSVYVIIFRGSDFMRTKLIAVSKVFSKHVY